MTKKELFDLENEYYMSIGGRGDEKPFDEDDHDEPFCRGIDCSNCMLNKNGGCQNPEIKEQFLIEWDKKRKEKADTKFKVGDRVVGVERTFCGVDIVGKFGTVIGYTTIGLVGVDWDEKFDESQHDGSGFFERTKSNKIYNVDEKFIKLVEAPPCFEFDWDAFKRREIIVKCTTEKECNEFVKACHDNGLHWDRSESTYTYWKDDVGYVLYFGYPDQIAYSHNECFYMDEKYNIVLFSDIKSGINPIDLSKFTDTQLLAEIKRRLERGAK